MLVFSCIILHKESINTMKSQKSQDENKIIFNMKGIIEGIGVTDL
jgi:hypothetical protein